MGSQQQYGGSISSNTELKTLYERRQNRDIYSQPSTPSPPEDCVRNDPNTPPPLPPIGRRNSVATITTNLDERSETAPPEYDRKSSGSIIPSWGKKINEAIPLFNTILIIIIGAIAIMTLNEIKGLKKNDQMQSRSISEHCVRLHVLELLVSDLKVINVPKNAVNETGEVEETEIDKTDLENEIITLQAEIKNLLEANRTCNDALRDTEIPTTKICLDKVEIAHLNNQVQDLLEANKTCSETRESQQNTENCSSTHQDEVEINNLNHQVQVLMEANKTCSEALENQHNKENCTSTRREIEMLEAEIPDLREANRTCFVELNDLKEDIPPCLVITPTIDPDAIDIYNWVNAPNGLEYWISGVVNFLGANTTCISKGAQMVVSGVREPSTREFLVDNLIGPRGVSVWIGLNDLDEEGVWFWQDGVLATTFNTNCGYRQPDNSYNSDCAELYSSYLMWDVPCHDTSRALCEREPISSA